MFSPIDFGENNPGVSGVSATGTTRDTAYLITRKITIFSSVASGAIAELPSSYASGAQPWIFNRDPANGLILMPPLGDQIEDLGVDVGVTIPPQADFAFVSFDPPAAKSPRTWWQTTMYRDGAFVPTGGGTMTGELIINNPSGTSLDARHNVLVGGTLTVGAGVAPPAGGLSAKGAYLNPLSFQISAGAAVPVFTIATALAGTISAAGSNGWNSINVVSDNLIMTGGSPVLSDIQINHNFGGTSWSGARQGITVNYVQTAAINLGGGGGLAGAVSGIASGIVLTNTFGGTGLTPATAAGAATAMNPYLIMKDAYTNGGGGSGMEIDVSGRALTSFLSKTGLAIVLDSADVVQGTLNDAALVFANQSEQGAARGWKALISTGTFNGYYPVATDGAFWVLAQNAGGSGHTVNKGLSWANGIFTTSAIETPGFTLSGAGIITTTLKVASAMSIGSSVGAGGNVDIQTPNGSNIRLIPQGTANVVAATPAAGQFQALTAAMFGGGAGTLSSGEIGMTKMVASGTAPGVAIAKLAVVAGTSPGTAKLIMYAGSSTTPTTIIDNVGGGF